MTTPEQITRTARPKTTLVKYYEQNSA